MNELQVFFNPEFGQVRSVIIDNDPWFVGKDVAVALGYKDTVNALKNHVDDEDKGGWQITTQFGEKTAVVINESGLYSLIFSSKLETAKYFKRWVTSEVLPTIRKTGSYGTSLDCLKAAQIVASCKNDRLPYVLSMLKQGGYSVPQVVSVSREVCSDIGRLMEESHISLNELSRMTNICKSSLSYYKRGIHKPSRERYQIIIEALNK